MIDVFKGRGIEPPIVYLHNHDFNGMGGHIGAGVLRKAQSEGYNYLVVDAGYRKNGTHNDNTVQCAALNLTKEQNEALIEYNHIQQQIEQVLCRFDSRISQMTPWDSDWAGGTEGSDIRICKEFNINPRLINHAKEVATAVFPLERAVTPFSEYKLRLGIGIMIEDGIQPKSADKVREWVNGGGKLKVGGDVLVGLKRWETLVPKTPEVDKLLQNMADELNGALSSKDTLVTPAALPADPSAAEAFTALGFQAKGLAFVGARGKGSDLSPLLLAPHVLHREPQTLEPGVRFELLCDPANYRKRVEVTFGGSSVTPEGDVTLSFKHEGETIAVTITPEKKEVADDGKVRKADPGNETELACEVPGELLTYAVEVGTTLKEGQTICKLESMKMEVVISVPKQADGMVVKALPLKARTKTDPCDKLTLVTCSSSWRRNRQRQL